MVRKLLSGILVYYYFDNMRANYNSGFTLIEAMVVIVIIVLISVFFVVIMKPDTIALLKMDTTRLAADIRYVRSMATTRATYDGSFPSDGYGIVFQNGNGTTEKSYYKLYAGSNLLKTVYLSNVAFRLVDPNEGYPFAIDITTEKKFFFKTENSVVASGFKLSATGDYQIDIYCNIGTIATELVYYKSQITLGQKTSDNFTWSNLATIYDTNTPLCGNGEIELGEECERYENKIAEDLDIIDSNCLLNCKKNQCGDGVIVLPETCEPTMGFGYCGSTSIFSCVKDLMCQQIDDSIGEYIDYRCCAANFCINCKGSKTAPCIW